MHNTMHQIIFGLSVAAVVARSCFGQAGNVDPTFSASVASPSGQPSVIHTFALQADGKILVGGRFESVDNNPRFRIARLNPDGSLDDSFVFVDPDNTVFSLAAQSDGKVLVGGEFATINGVSQSGLARLLPDGSLDTPFHRGGVLNAVRSIACDSQGRILIGGTIFFVDAVVRYGVARLSNEGALDQGFVPFEGTDANCRAIIPLTDGRIVVGGHFSDTVVGQHSISRLSQAGASDTNFWRSALPPVFLTALIRQGDGKFLTGPDGIRLNPDGTSDQSFQHSPGPNGSIYSIAVQPGGKIIMAGDFTTYHGVPANRIVRLHTNGTVDMTFTASANTNINTIALQPDGRILIGGEFSMVNGEPRTRIARLLGDNPVLASAKSGPNMVLSWPSVYTNYTLEAATALPSTQWITLSTSPVAVNNEWAITNAISRGNRFFRLSKP